MLIQGCLMHLSREIRYRIFHVWYHVEFLESQILEPPEFQSRDSQQ